jgi:biotin-dependent carboxylase-like uncharacterized protein
VPGLTAIDPGMFTTVQDLGRPGFASLGVAPGGAADAASLRVCNILLGNDDDAPGLEFTLTAGVFRADMDLCVAISAGLAHAHIVDPSGARRAVPTWAVSQLRAGEEVRLGPITGRARAYLCVAGGFRVEHVLASASTHVAGGFGGHQGRPLRAGDALRCERCVAPARTLPHGLRRLVEDPPGPKILDACSGPHAAHFSPQAIDAFWNARFIVGRRSDRVGVRLEGSPVPSPAGGRLISSGVPAGAVQVPEGGHPIILGVDHPTTGGYPVIACLSRVAMDTLGRALPGDTLAFRRVSPEDARAARAARDASLDALRHHRDTPDLS